MTEADPKKLLLERFIRIRKDPIEFLKAVRTLDEVDRKNPIKHFPWDLEYIQWYVAIWRTEQFIAVPKSRRMKMSWINIALCLWDAMFHEGVNIAFVSKKEDDSDALVQRAKFIYDNLDAAILPKELLPAALFKYNHLSFPEMYSKISGYPSGADQLRQFTFSRILGDECAFWENAQAMYAGAVPTTEGGGQFVMISSRAPGFFKNLVYDQMDNLEEFDAELLVAGKKKSPMTGLTVWRNQKNKFFIFELHYTADPAKRSEEWKNGIKPRMALRDWNREYEGLWDTYEGLPVFGEWNKQIHARDNLEPQVGLPLLRGWDFGLTPACIVAQLQGRKLVVLHEFTAMNMGADRFSDLVLPKCQVLFSQWGSGRASQWIDFIDPAGQNRDQSNEGTCAKILDSKGLSCIPGAIAFEARRKAVEHFLTSTDGDGPNFLLDRRNCPVLARGFDGGYRYAETALSREPNKLFPIKDEHSHPQDALQYVATGILDRRPKRMQSNIPQIRYRFGVGESA